MELFITLLLVFGLLGLFCDWTQFLILLTGFLIIMGTTGYITNIIGFINSDFEPPYKEEAIRGVGILLPPMGAVTGYITIEDGKEE